MGVLSARLKSFNNYRSYIISWGVLLIAYLLGLFVYPMDIDSAQYAAMSMEMWQNKSFLEITNLGKPYLDKPPLIFWLSSLSMGIFGFYPWAFKLPTFLSTILGIYSVYRLTNRLWGKPTARNASIILASSVAWLVFNNDVRTDALLVNFVIFSCWQFVEWHVSQKNVHLVAVTLGVALAMLAKGPIGAISVGVWICCWLFFHKDWKSLFHIRWILVAFFIGILLLPMCWGLYNQYGWKGIRFYFWTQSFGRITGESEWVNHPGIGYFFPILAWCFFPWTVFMIWGIVVSIMRKLTISAAEKTLIISSLILFAALSLSRYKLPHYIFIILPWLSIFTARCMEKYENQLFKKSSMIYTWILFIFISVAIPLLMFLFLSIIPLWFGITWVVLVSLIFLIIRWKNITVTLATILAGTFIILNGWFYPHLLSYQGTSVIGCLARKKEINPEKIRVTISYPSYALTFAYQHVLRGSDPWLIFEELEKTDYLWVICDEPHRDYMRKIGIRISEENKADYYPVSRLKPLFIYKQSRSKLLQPIYLCKVTR